METLVMLFCEVFIRIPYLIACGLVGVGQGIIESFIPKE